MIYITSNLRGNYQKALELLRAIRFSDRDVLYLLGNTAHGEKSMELLVDFSQRNNVYPIAGHRDYQALRMLKGLSNMTAGGTPPSDRFVKEMTEWVNDGGAPTVAAFRGLTEEMKEGVLDYLFEFSLYDEVEVKGKTYLLAERGIPAGFSEETADDYSPEDFFTPHEENMREKNRTVITAAPTEGGKVARNGSLIRLGFGLNGAPLGCFCLDTGEEFYV